MPGRENGFYAAWRALAPSDPTLARAVRKELRTVADRADYAALAARPPWPSTTTNGSPTSRPILTRLPGWAAHVQWCSGRGVGIDALQYLAVRLTYEWALLAREGHRRAVDEVPGHIPSTRERAAHLMDVWGLTEFEDTELAAAARVLTAMPVTAREVLWQNAFEGHYRDGLLAQLGDAGERCQTGPVHTQLVSCIDTRSEGLRRQLETLGGYETLASPGSSPLRSGSATWSVGTPATCARC